MPAKGGQLRRIRLIALEMGEGAAVLAIQADEQEVLALPGGEIRPGATPFGDEAPEYLPQGDY